MKTATEQRPLIAHVVFRFDVGGLENGVVNLINRMPPARFRHAVIALTEVTRFSERIQRDDVQFIALGKGPGHGIRLAPQLWRLFRELRPAVVHTRNLAALEASLPAAAARVPVRIHGEHGWDVTDLAGENRKNRLIRRLHRPFVSQYIALSADIERYLVERVGVEPRRVAQIYNGVDTQRFSPGVGRTRITGCPFDPAKTWLVGTVGRMQSVKNQIGLVHAFIRACASDAQAAESMRLVIVGDGPERGAVTRALTDAGLIDRAWLPGTRDDVDAVLRGLDCFVLPSLAEGVSNTLLEAMATGLPVIATRVGGNPELIDDGHSGMLVAAGDVDAMRDAILSLFRCPSEGARLGTGARHAVEQRFSLDRMAAEYARLYDRLLHRATPAVEGVGAMRSSP